MMLVGTEIVLACLMLLMLTFTCYRVKINADMIEDDIAASALGCLSYSTDSYEQTGSFLFHDYGETIDLLTDLLLKNQANVSLKGVTLFEATSSGVRTIDYGNNVTTNVVDGKTITKTGLYLNVTIPVSVFGEEKELQRKIVVTIGK